MQSTTRDEYIQSVYKVVFYIEQNYNENLTLEELAQVASFSKFHFHIIFKSIIGESLADYIRRVRLQSSSKMFTSNEKITTIALDSGYETNSSFTKAFKKHLGITPKEFSLNVKKRKGNKMLTPKFIEIDDIEILSVRGTGAYIEAAPKTAEILMKFAYTQKIKYKKNLMGKEARCFGIAHDDPKITHEDKIRFDMCITWDDKSVKPEGEILSNVLKGGKYAQFLHKGPYINLHETYAQVTNWIIEKEISLRNEPFFEEYLNRDPRRTKPENLKTLIHVPIE
jgi:AraC family transcriptional regulator